MTQDDAEFIPTRTALLRRLHDWHDQAGWQLFFDTYWKLIYGVARRTGLTEEEAQDAVQETLVSVAKHIPSFKYDPALGSFKGWLLKMARWRIIDQLRKRGPFSAQDPRSSNNSTSTGTEVIDAVPDGAGNSLDEHWEAEWQRTLLQAATTNVKRRLDPERYQVFDCYVNKEWEASKVAETFGMSIQNVYVVRHRITQMIKEEVERLEKEVT